MKSKEIKCPIDNVNDSMFIEVTLMGVAKSVGVLDEKKNKVKENVQVIGHKVVIKYEGAIIETYEAYSDTQLLLVIKAAEQTAQERLRQKHTTEPIEPWIERALVNMGYK